MFLQRTDAIAVLAAIRQRDLITVKRHRMLLLRVGLLMIAKWQEVQKKLQQGLLMTRKPVKVEMVTQCLNQLLQLRSELFKVCPEYSFNDILHRNPRS